MYLKFSKKNALGIRILSALLIVAFLINNSVVVFAMDSDENSNSTNTENVISEEVVEEEEGVEEEEIPEDNEDDEETPEEQESSETIIDTGNAVSEADVMSEVNSNEVNTESEEGGGESEEENEEATNSPAVSDDENDNDENVGTTTPEVSDQNNPEDSETEDENGTTTPETRHERDYEDRREHEVGTSTEPQSEQNIENENEAEIENNVEVDALTGLNEAEGEDVLIDTGNALASANIVNLANTNIFNSDGFMLFFNELFSNSSVDLRDIFPVFENKTTTPSCTLELCDQENTKVNIKNENDGTIVNDVIVRSSTGENSATGETGDATIQTGDALASANVVNVLNTNITDSNYLLLSFNNLGNFGGDIVLPNKDFFSGLFSGNSSLSGVNIENENEAEIENNVDVNASTGGNIATSTDGNSEISTGNATSATNVTNHVNTNITNSDSFTMIFRISGNFNGDVFGLPDGFSWIETDGGIQIFNTSDGGPLQLNSPNLSSLNVQNGNNASIKNNVSVIALTGDNKASGNGSMVQTGDALASANILNVANTNVLGRNWALMVFNIFGDFNGDIAFGLPDLWIGGTVESDNQILNEGDSLRYNFTIRNNGDIDATDVILESKFDKNLHRFKDYENENEDGVSWNLGTISAGETIDVSFDGEVNEDIPFGQTAIEIEANVSSRQSDNNYEDNTEYLTVLAERHRDRSVSNRKKDKKDDFNQADVSDSEVVDYALDMVKTSGLASTTASSTVPYSITILNSEDSLYDALLVDTLKDEDGNIINEQVWDLGQIFPNEDIVVSYDFIYGGTTTPGIYTNYAQIFAYDSEYVDANRIKTNIASTSVEIISENILEVSKVCGQYISKFLKFGQDNDRSEVIKLQRFLRDFEGYGVEINGEFDLLTEIAVRDFQNKYSDKVLGPWGIDGDTGYVYLTTRKIINEIYCHFNVEFPLTLDQRSEIERYRDMILRGELPINSPVGSSDNYPLHAMTPFVDNLNKSKKEDPVVDNKSNRRSKIAGPPRIIFDFFRDLFSFFKELSGRYLTKR